MLRQAATERAATAPEAVSRGGGCHIFIYLPSTKAWKRYSMAIPCNSCTYTLPIHFYSYVYWAIPVSNFRNIRFLLGQNTTMAVTLAGPRGHRNLQWFLRPGPHAQGQRWNSSTV